MLVKYHINYGDISRSRCLLGRVQKPDHQRAPLLPTKAAQMDRAIGPALLKYAYT